MDCSAKWYWEVVFDPDIAGPGVLAGFLSTAIFTMMALVVGFATYSIPAGLVCEIDGLIVRALREIYASACKKLGLRAPRGLVDVKSHDQRVHALQTFMISLSDQILVSQLAILIAAWGGFQDLTIYGADIVTKLALLASTVYVTSMLLLAPRLQQQRLAKIWRIILLVIATILLVALMALSLSGSWFDGSHIYAPCSAADFYWGNVENTLWVFVVAGGTSYSAFGVIYALLCPRMYPAQTIFLEDKDTSPSAKIRKAEIKTLWNANPSHVRREWFRQKAYGLIKQKAGRGKQKYHALSIAESYAFHAYCESFTDTIVWLLSAAIYGIISVFHVRGNTPDMSGDRDRMSFGQLVPLILLLLPIFGAMQSLYDYRDAMQNEKEHESHRPIIASPSTSTSKSSLNLQGTASVARTSSSSSSSTQRSKEDSISNSISNALRRRPTSDTAPESPVGVLSTTRSRVSIASSTSTSTSTSTEDPFPHVYRVHTLGLITETDADAGCHGPLRQWCGDNNDPTDWPSVRVWVGVHTVLQFVVAIFFALAFAIPGMGYKIYLVFSIVVAIRVRKYSGRVLFPMRLYRKGVRVAAPPQRRNVKIWEPGTGAK